MGHHLGQILVTIIALLLLQLYKSAVLSKRFDQSALEAQGSRQLEKTESCPMVTTAPNPQSFNATV